MRFTKRGFPSNNSIGTAGATPAFLRERFRESILSQCLRSCAWTCWEWCHRTIWNGNCAPTTTIILLPKRWTITVLSSSPATNWENPLLQNQEDRQQQLHNDHSIFQSSGIIRSFDNINEAFKKGFDDRWWNTFWEREQWCCCCTTKDGASSKTGGCRGGGVLSTPILEPSLKSQWRSQRRKRW